MNAPPPPPPPHGSNAGGKASGLPPGNYDIFIIPPHSSGSGFLYLPSLQPHRNSFLAGVACTLFAVAIWSIVAPIFRDWFATIMATGGMGVVMLMVGVGVAGWAWGKTQLETGGPGEGSTGSQHGSGNTTGGAGSQHAGGNAPGGPPPGSMPGGAGARATPKPSWQRANTGPANGSAGAGNARGGWEKAREDTRRKEEERKRTEDLRRRKEEEEVERVRQREREAQERLAREEELRQWQARAKEAEEKEARRREAEAHEAKEKEVKDKEAKEKEAQERGAREKEAREKEAREKRVKEYRERVQQQKNKEQAATTSPTKKHQQPTASTDADEASSYSYRPYDKLKRPVHKANSASSMCSESSYAPSQSTSRTTPPPSHRGPYHTKDPDKIVIKAVYSFNNTFPKLPIAQLVSGVGTVTDGLILRITTEGLFIDDDVRGVPQREWDIKAWTLKLVEVWCPPCGASSGSTSASARTPTRPSLFGGGGGGKSSTRIPTGEDSDAFLENLLRVCKNKCGSGPNASRASSQSGELKGLHVLRASIRDQEGKRYVFVLQGTEGWKVAVGLQRLRRGTQVRALGVSGMAVNETKSVLEGLGWG